MNQPGCQAVELDEMKMKKPLLKQLSLVASVLLYCAPNLPAQTAPTITNQPASQTNLVGSNVTFSVAVSGTGPFSYQWQFNGTNIPNNIISTVAGYGGAGYYGDGGAATNAELWNPCGMAFDVYGSLLFADDLNNRIRKVDTNGIITTVAGNGNSGFSGDGGAATNARVYGPAGVALDTLGNLYIAESGNKRIRKVAANGIITTVAGNGTNGFSGDGGAATNASLYDPNGVVLDAVGDFYIADTGNNRIRKVDTNGVITTVAGNGTNGFSGDGGSATNASLDAPEGVAADAAGNLYIADTDNNRIRKVGTNGIINTVAGNGSFVYSGNIGDGGPATSATLVSPQGVAVDALGDLYIADTQDYRIRKVGTNGIITTIVGNGSASFRGDGGTAASASLAYPEGVTLDATGNLYISDTLNNRIRKVLLGVSSPLLTLSSVFTNYSGNYSVIITSPYGSVTSAVATLTVVLPPSILVQPASQVVLPGSNATFSVTATGTLPLYYSWYFNSTNLLQAGTNTALVVSNASTVNAGSYAVVITNDFAAVTSGAANLIVAYPPFITSGPSNQTVLSGNNIVLTVSVGATPGPFTYQWQQNGMNLPITNFTISTIAGNGTAVYSGDGVSATNTGLGLPKSVAIDGAGNLYVADMYNDRIRKVGTNGIISTVLLGLDVPEGVAVDALGNLYVANTDNNVILKVATNGSQTQVAGNGSLGYSGDGGAATSAKLKLPQGVTVDAAGENFIADTGNNRVRKVATNGVITTVAGNGTAGYFGDGAIAANAGLHNPLGVALDAFGNLYIADAGNQCIRKVYANGIITTVAGNGTNGFSGEGGAAVLAELSNPSGLAFDAFGYLYIADTGNERIRIVGTNGIITTIAGNGSAGYGGDGGAATSAELHSPTGLAFDVSGNLYVADTTNNRIRQMHPAGFPTLTLTNVSGINAGNYTVVVTTPYGSATSGVATLAVEGPPVITVQPASQLVAPGGSALFSVQAAGSGSLGYLWYLAATNLIQSGANNTLALASASTNNAGNYTVVVTNNYGSVTSQVAALLVLLTQPLSQEILNGASTVLSVAVAGSVPLGYQWQDNGTNLPNNNIITTVAGGGNLGDGGPATNARIVPLGAACDAAGNLYIADSFNNLIRRVDTNGNITTIAGNGVAGFSGDGGPATNASLGFPSGVTVDAAGDIYIADAGNNRIREVGTNGIINTIAGDGNFVYSGNGGDGGPATSATLDVPQGVAVDAVGNLYIADTGDNRIRKVGTNGVITTVSSGLAVPEGVAVDALGNIYIANTENNVILKVATNGSQTQVAGGLNFPQGVAVDGAGNLYVADTYNNRVRRVATNGLITTLAGNGNQGYSGDGGAASSASLFLPGDVALGATGNLYIADTYNNRIRKVATNNVITTIAGTSIPLNSVAATNANLYVPTGVATDAAGSSYIADCYNQRIRKVSAGGTITTIAGNGLQGDTGDGGAATNASLSQPQGVTLDAAGNLYFADYVNNRIRKVDINSNITTFAGNGNGFGSFSGDGGQATNASLGFPFGVAADAAGNLYIADSDNNRIRKVGTNGIIKTVAGDGNFVYSGNGGDGGPATSATLDYPKGVAVDAAGNLYIADTADNRIRKVGTNGIITTLAGNGNQGYSGDGDAATNSELDYPDGLAVDTAGNLYIADHNNSRIRMVATNGIIKTVAGNVTNGFSGDGGSATNARLDYPRGVALDTLGNLYIADGGNNRIREVHFAGLPTLALTNVSAANAGNYTVVINGLFGSVTSPVATVTLASSNTPPAIISGNASFGIVSNQFSFDLSGVVGQTIIIDGSSDLANWIPLFTNTAGATPFFFSDPAWTNFPARFYRARLQ
jgi:sugar lactone lactonase YvrE